MNQTARKPGPIGLEVAEAKPANTSDRNLSPQLVTLSDPLSSAAEAIRALRTHVLVQHIQQGRRALAVCAPSEGVGCTFVAANLAVALAQVGVKTLLVDGNLRAPELHNIILPLAPTGGLSAALATANGSIGDFIEHDVLPNCSVLYAGQAASNAQELLARDRFEDIMLQCLRDHDITIVDTPPANTCADARRISNVVGYGVVVARRNKSLVADVKTLASQLAEDHAKVIGTILNAD